MNEDKRRFLVKGQVSMPCRNLPRRPQNKTGRAKLWTWVFRADRYAVFKIDESRGSKVPIDVLGEEFDGVLGCDCFSTCRKHMGDFSVAVQFRLARLIRDLKFPTALPDRATAGYGERVLRRVRDLFGVFHRREKSLFLSLKKNRDERIEAALEQLMRALRWQKDWICLGSISVNMQIDIC